MNFFSRIFRKKTGAERPIITPDDSQITRRVKEAKWLNAHAVTSFVEAAKKQERDANLARQVIHDVLARSDLKAPNHAGNKK